MTAESPAASWRAEQLRLTVFTKTIGTPERSSWWADVVGTEPERRSEQSREHQWSDVGPTGEEGPTPALLAVRAGPRRIDWLLGKRRVEDLGAEAFPHVGPATDAFARFRALLGTWLRDSSPSSNRIAFGAILVSPVASREAGYAMLSESLVPFKIGATSRDFAYQINRRRESTTRAGLNINRLSKWSVALAQASVVDASTGEVVEEEPERFATRLELDINTAPGETDDLSGADAVALFDELITLGGEIAEHGDHP